MVSFLLFLTPMLILKLVLGEFSETIDWATTNGMGNAHEGMVFTATVGILFRIFFRTGIRVGIRTGVRSGIRTGVRSGIRTGVRETLRHHIRPLFGENEHKNSWLYRSLFPDRSDVSQQHLSAEIIRVVSTYAVLLATFAFVALVKMGSPNGSNPYSAGERLIPDALALFCVLIFFYTIEKIYVEIIENEDYRFYMTPDGVLIQVLFALGLSFLPLTHDSECSGEKKVRAHMGLVGIGGLLILALLSAGALEVLGSGTPVSIALCLSGISDFAVLFALLFSFPIQPFEGADIYSWNRIIGILTFLFCLVVAAFGISEGLAFLI